MKISTKLIGLVTTSLCLVGIVASTVSIISLQKRGEEQISATRDLLMHEKREMLENLVESISNTISVITSEEDLLKVVRKTRYSADRSGYFWINDMGMPYPTMVMHPIIPELEGKVMDDPKFNCAMGKNQNLFQAFNETCQSAAQKGFVPYLWPKPGQDKSVLHPKLSFVKKMADRPWIIGTGIYVDDVEVAVSGIRKNISDKIRSQIFILMGVLAGLITVSLVLCAAVVGRIVRPIDRISADLRELAVGTADLSKRIGLDKARCSDITHCNKKECSCYGKECHCWINAGSLSDQIQSKLILDGTYSSCRECKQVYQVFVHDEITSLSSYFNAFLSKFQKIFASVIDGIGTLNQSAKGLQDLSGIMKDLSRKTLEQTTNTVQDLEKVNADNRYIEEAMKNSTVMIEQVAATAGDMTSLVKDVGANSDKARTITGSAVEKAKSASMRIADLGTAAKDIDTVTEVITEISEQTNLLALNATIEAARAGEAGKGFAVVANEIKELARQTAGATLQIKEKIKGIQSSTESTVTEIGQVSEVIYTVNDLITGISASLEEQLSASLAISESVSASARDVGGVHGHVREISATSSHVEKKVGDISSHVQDMTSDITKILEKADGLVSLADRLKGLVGSYKI